MIYDCFTFFNELDLLEIRLNELNSIVDKFVIVEANKTHQGAAKALFFQENKERFAAFKDKIIHIIVDDFPAAENAWTLERFQRNAIARGLSNCQANDVIMVSDLDEIPNKETVLNCQKLNGIKLLKQKTFYYFLNCVREDGNEMPKETWIGTTICYFKDFSTAQAMRDISIKYLGLASPNLIDKIFAYGRILFKTKDRHKVLLIKNGGWHFSFLGGIEKIINKIESFAHTEFNKDLYKDASKLEAAINSGNDIFGRNMKFKFIKIDKSFPETIYLNQQKYKALIK